RRTAAAPSDSPTLPLRDALPISSRRPARGKAGGGEGDRHRRFVVPRADGRAGRVLRWYHPAGPPPPESGACERGVDSRAWSRGGDRESTRLNSSHVKTWYAVSCL